MPLNSRPGSMDCGDECFYSFPSSRNASHEVSSTTNDSSEENERAPKSTCSLSTALNKDALLLDTETDRDHDEMTDSTTPRSSKVKWTLPFVQQRDSPRHHHFCSKPVLNHLCRNNRLPSGFYHPSDGSYIPDRSTAPSWRTSTLWLPLGSATVESEQQASTQSRQHYTVRFVSGRTSNYHKLSEANSHKVALSTRTKLGEQVFQSHDHFEKECCGSQLGIYSRLLLCDERHSQRELLSKSQRRKDGHGGTVSAPNEMNLPPTEQVQSCGRIKHWIKTSDGDTHQLSRDADTSTLYHRGVDAHSEAPSPDPKSRSEEERPKITVSSEEICGNKKREQFDYTPHDRRSSESDVANPSLHKLHRYSFMPLEDRTPESLRSSEQRSVCLGHPEEVPLRGQPSTPGKATLEDILTRFIYINDEPRRSHATACCCAASRSKL
ncbi:hypothetical protein BJ166DRAFT_605674 [Pestalotiopsis sp. NC0098]|nr:hypothetical protein BJ166DRAFT_605674 [Pestalotiopsis sp. NC0098]